MDGSYEVVTSSLTNHVRAVTGLAGELSSALDAAGVTVTGDAFGQTGARFAASLGEVARAGQDTLRTGIDALDKAATALRDTVTAYEQQDTTDGARFTQIGGAQP